MAVTEYENFDIRIDKVDDRTYQVTAESEVGSASREVGSPFSQLELQNFILRAGLVRSPARRGTSTARAAARELGRGLFESFMGGNVGDAFNAASGHAEQSGVGLRIRLQLDGAPDMAHYPWEFWNRAMDDQFLVLSRKTPIVRYVPTDTPLPPLPVEPPLRILLMVSNPTDSTLPALDTDKELESVTRALEPMTSAGLVELVPLERATLNDLRDALTDGGGHIVHFVGHGLFDATTGEGLLEMEDDMGRSRLVPGRDLGTMLRDFDVRLVVLNSCEGARNDTMDPFAGAATSLILKGVPAVIAMQFEITDAAAEQLARAFYAGIVRSEPVDTALTEARLRLFGSGSDTEWATPVLYLQSESGRLFEMAAVQEEVVPELVSATQTAIDRDDWHEAARLISRAEVFRPEDAEIAQRAQAVRQRVKGAEMAQEVRWLAQNGDPDEARAALIALVDAFPEFEGDEELKLVVGRLDAPSEVPAQASPQPPPRLDAAQPTVLPREQASRSWAPRRLGILWGIIAVLAIAAVVFGIIAFLPPNVPDVVGETEQHARGILMAAGIDVETLVVASDQPAEVVVAQDPAGGRARSVQLEVSEGPPKVVPSVIGLTEAQGLAALSAMDIAATTIDRSDDAPPGTVIEVVPPEGTEADGAVLVVSSGAPPPTVPLVVGESVSDATATLTAASITVDTEGREDQAPAGTVLDQQPAAGEQSASVLLLVSAGPGLPVVPDVLGANETDALAVLQGEGIAVDTERVSDPLRPVGEVMTQTPAAGDRAESVLLQISSGPAVSDFVGNWENIDEDTTGTTRLVIDLIDDATVQVHGFGSCGETDCDWGVTSGLFADQSIEATFEFGYKRTTVAIERAGALILVRQLDDYAEEDAREDRESTYVMSDVPVDELSVSDLSIIGELQVFDEIVGSPGSIDLINLIPITGELAPVAP